MKKLLPTLVLVLLAAVAGVYFMYGPSFLLGGPSRYDIVNVARQVMQATSANDAEKQLAAGAEITPRGLCNNMSDGTYACIVDVAAGGQPATSMVATLKKDAGGAWISAQ